VGEFWLGETAVTLGQFRRFVRDSGHRPQSESRGCSYWTGSKWEESKSKNWRSPGFSQLDSQPVVCVSWNDAWAYAKWLSRKTGRRFRLPMESEWEYAARAGTQTARYWGDGIGNNNANCDKCGSHWNGSQTAPVGSFKPNAFGLFDMLGNVWEWTCSQYRKSYDGSEQKCSVSASSYSLRGGSWLNFTPWRVRAAFRDNSNPGHRGSSVGFRLARDIEMTEEESNAEAERKREEEPPKKVEPVVIETPIKTYVTNEPSTSKQSDVDSFEKYEYARRSSRNTIGCKIYDNDCEKPLIFPKFKKEYQVNSYRRIRLIARDTDWQNSGIKIDNNTKILFIGSGKAVKCPISYCGNDGGGLEGIWKMRIWMKVNEEDKHNLIPFHKKGDISLANIFANNFGKLKIIMGDGYIFKKYDYSKDIPKDAFSVYGDNSGYFLIDIFTYNSNQSENFRVFLKDLMELNNHDLHSKFIK